MMKNKPGILFSYLCLCKTGITIRLMEKNTASALLVLRLRYSLEFSLEKDSVPHTGSSIIIKK